MGQVTVYLENETEIKVKRAARKAGHSLSKWLSHLLKRELDSRWPEGVKEMAGAWNDFPALKEIRSTEGRDLQREDF